MGKTTTSVFMNSEIKKILEKRAKHDFLSFDELVTDILRRSALSYRGGSNENDKVDDKFVTYFSRKNKKSLKAR